MRQCRPSADPCGRAQRTAVCAFSTGAYEPCDTHRNAVQRSRANGIARIGQYALRSGRCGWRTTTTLEQNGSRRMHRRAACKFVWRHACCAVESFVGSFEVASFCVGTARYCRYAGGLITPTIAFQIESGKAPECVALALHCVIRAYCCTIVLFDGWPARPLQRIVSYMSSSAVCLHTPTRCGGF